MEQVLLLNPEASASSKPLPEAVILREPQTGICHRREVE